MTHPFRTFFVAACLFLCAACSPEDTVFEGRLDRSADVVADLGNVPQDVGMGGDLRVRDLVDAAGRDGTVEPDQAEEVEPRMLFELERVGERAGFYDFPMPSDLRLDAGGRPELDAMPTASKVALLEQLRRYVKVGVPGFAPHTTSYIRFTHPLDTAEFEAALTPEAPQAPVWLVDVDRQSPDFGKKLPLDLQFRSSSTTYWRSNTLSARVIPGARVRPGTRYALLIRDGLRTEAGVPIKPSLAFEALLDSPPGPGRLSQHYTQLFEVLGELGIDPRSLLGATMYTTSDPRPQMDALAKAARSVPLEPLGRWTVQSRSGAGTLLLGSFMTQDFLSGEPPFAAPGSGEIVFDLVGQPIIQRRSPVRVSLLVPHTPPPPGGYPVVVHSHGTGGDVYSGTLGAASPGQRLAAHGIATLGFDGALHGERTAQAFDYATRVVQNVLVVREMIRQTVVDQIVLLRHLEAGLGVPAGLVGGQAAGEGEEVAFSREPWVFGHSQGGQQNGVLVGLDVPLRGAFFSAAPGALYVVLNDQLLGGQRLGCLLGLLAGIKCEDMTYAHPAISLLYQQTHAVNEPLNFAGRALLERPESWGPAPHLALTEGLEDTTTPPDSLEALAGALGVPTVAPSLRMGWALRFLEQPVVGEPVSENVRVGQQRVSAGLFQFAGLDHFAVFRDQRAANAYINFFVSGMFGQAPRLDRSTPER